MRFRRTGPTSRSLADLYHCCSVSLGVFSGGSEAALVDMSGVVVRWLLSMFEGEENKKRRNRKERRGEERSALADVGKLALGGFRVGLVLGLQRCLWGLRRGCCLSCWGLCSCWESSMVIYVWTIIYTLSDCIALSSTRE